MTEEYRILGCGSRGWRDEVAVAQVIRDWLPTVIPSSVTKDEITIVHGGQVSKDDDGNRWGADYLIGEVARRHGYRVEPHPVDWIQARRELGVAYRTAGMLRNSEMLRLGVNLCFALHDDPGLGKGTYDMTTKCLKARIPVWLWRHVKPQDGAVLAQKLLRPVR